MAGDRTGCGYYRIFLPLGELKRQGHEVLFSGKHDARDFDVIVGQRVSNQGPHDEWLKLAAQPRWLRKYRLVFEIDDDLWQIDRSNSQAWDFYVKDQPRLGRLRRCCEAADLVTTTTEPLAQVLRKINPNVAVIPNYPDEMILSVSRKPTEALTIGFGGSASHAGDWAGEPAAGTGKFLTRNRDVLIHFVGAEFAKMLPGSVRGRVRFTPWQMSVPRYYESLSMDIGLAPLQRSAFNASKSALKVTEYSMLGIVPVFSGAAAYEGYPGLRCASAADWYRALRSLLDPAERKRLLEECRAYTQGMTIQRNAYRWLEAYESVL